MYNATGWYQVESGFWAHVQGTCKRADMRKYKSDWIARPHGLEAARCRTLRDAKKYVETNGAHQNTVLA